MKYVVIRLWERADGTWGVSVGEQETSPGRRVPSTSRRPWEHTFTLQGARSSADVFRAIREAIKGISDTADFG